jgi:ABC-type Fe3+-hydroxamate transport system substrate-binding protein
LIVPEERQTLARCQLFDTLQSEIYHPRQMGQQRILIFVFFIVVAGGGIVWWVQENSDKMNPAASGVTANSGAAPDASGANSSAPKIASLVPAGTDMVVTMGCADQLVGVSNFDTDRPEISGKPRIGDYNNINWEKLAAIHPQFLIVDGSADRIPAGVQQHCQDLNIQLVNVRMDTLEDIYTQARMLGVTLGRVKAAEDAIQTLQLQLAKIQSRTSGKYAVRTLLVTSENGTDLAGPHTFLDDILTIAGGSNVARDMGKTYVTVDREKLTAMSPDVVIQLLPDAVNSPQLIDKAHDFWETMPTLPACKNQRIHIVTGWSAGGKVC